MIVTSRMGAVAVVGAILLIGIAADPAAATRELDLALAKLDSLDRFDIAVVRQLVALGAQAVPSVLERLDSPNRPTVIAAAMAVGELGGKNVACGLLERWAVAHREGGCLGVAIALKQIILGKGRSQLESWRDEGHLAVRALLDSVFCVGPSASLADTATAAPLAVWVGFRGCEPEWYLSCGARIMNSEVRSSGSGRGGTRAARKALFHCYTMPLDPDACQIPAVASVFGEPPSALAVVCVQELPLAAHTPPPIPLGCELWALCSGHWRFMQVVE